MTHQYLERKKNYQRPLLSFSLVWFVVNVLVFVCNGLKQSVILQANPNRFLYISFFIGTLFMFILKKHLALMWRDLDTSLLPCLSYLFVSLILLRKFALISPGTRSSSHEEKISWQSLYMFLEPRCMNIPYSESTWWCLSI